MPPIRKVSRAQLEELVVQMECHPRLAVATQWSGAQAKVNSHKLWAAIGSRLNAAGGGMTKTGKEWRSYWTDLKYKIRRKASQVLNHRHRASKGLPWSEIWTPVEERICRLIGVNINVGHEEVPIKYDRDFNQSAVMTNSPLPCPSTSQIQALPTPAVSDENLEGLTASHPLSPPCPLSSLLVDEISIKYNEYLIPIQQPDPLSSPEALSSPRELSSPDPLSSSDALSSPCPPKRKRTAKRAHSPAHKTKPHAGPPRWALDMERRHEATMKRMLEARLVTLAEAHLEEDRKFRRMMEQRTEELTQLLRQTLAALTSARQNN